MKIYFPEYKNAFGKIDGAFSLELLKAAPFPDELAALGTEGMKQIWHEAKLRGRGYANASSILEYARKSVGIKDGADAGRQAVKWFVSRIIGLVACSSGKHTGETKISHRGRKRLRYWLFQAAKSAVAHSEEFKKLHVYYTTRK